MKHASRYRRTAFLGALLWAAPHALSAQTSKANYPYIINLRTLNDNGHQEVYTTYYPNNDREKKEKLEECKALAPKVIGRPDSNYRAIISSSCTVDY